jgi:CheY-like chemotaxis protein
VFWNLLSNAVKFTPRGGEVRVALLRWGDEVLVTVTDTGPGHRARVSALIFERFQQADTTSTRRHGGLGLGLSIVRQLVELHDGWVWADSAGPGKGATFTVSLPRAVAAQEKPARETLSASLAAVEQSAARPASLDGARVLVVDDEADARDLVTKLLQAQGAHVMSAPSAAEALITFARVHPEVLVPTSVCRMADGYKLIAGVRALEAAQGNTPALAVALTAYARAEDRERACRRVFNVTWPSRSSPPSWACVADSQVSLRRREENKMSDQHEVQQVLARYVRATDERDGATVASLFLPDGRVEIYCKGNEGPKLLGVLCGPEAVARAVGQTVKPSPTLCCSHHTTHDHIIDIDGDQAHIDAQFVVFNTIETKCL